MKKKLIYIQLIVLSVFWQNAMALEQTDSVKVLKEFSKTEQRRLQFFSSSLQLHPDSNLTQLQPLISLQNLLGMSGGVSIRSYGSGGLGSMSIRGSTAQQSNILWNGIPIEQSATGQLDLSMVQPFLFNDIVFQPGGSSTLWGSGSIGASLQLNNFTDTSRVARVSLVLGAGTLKEALSGLRIFIPGNRIKYSLNSTGIWGLNEFEYLNEYYNPAQKDTNFNSETKQGQILQSLQIKTGKRSKLSLNQWVTFSNRHLPASMTESISLRTQKDLSIKHSAEYRSYFKNFSFFSRLAYMNDLLFYSDPSINLKDSLKQQNWFSETGLESNLKQKINWALSAIYYRNSVQNDGYNSAEKNRNRIAVAGFIQYKPLAKTEFTISFREEMVDGKTLPILFFAGVNQRINKWGKAGFNFSKNYRIPTMNDLYWSNGGNVKTLPEYGYSAEFQLPHEFVTQNRNWSFEFTPILFHRQMFNLIRWIPAQGSWSVINSGYNRSRGIESRLKISFRSGKNLIVFNSVYTYCISNGEHISLKPDFNELQAVYVPVYLASASILYQRNKWSLGFYSFYSGYVYALPDHSLYMNPYILTDAGLNRIFTIKKRQLKFFLFINNLTDTNYQSVMYFPMPGRNVKSGIQINF